jgi:hypothetical protein
MNDIGLRDLCRTVLLCASASLLLACNKEAGGLPPDKTAAQITAYNHTPDYIHQFYVDDAWGGNVFAYVGGGKFVCCVVYPRKWYPELKVTVRWTTSSSDPNATGDDAVGHWHETIVPIEQYDKPGTVQVHFLPDRKVRVIVSDYFASHPDYPGPRSPVKPTGFKW